MLTSARAHALRAALAGATVAVNVDEVVAQERHTAPLLALDTTAREVRVRPRLYVRERAVFKPVVEFVEGVLTVARGVRVPQRGGEVARVERGGVACGRVDVAPATVRTCMEEYVRECM